jgi:membrane-associated phospholipid phosphatase
MPKIRPRSRGRSRGRRGPRLSSKSGLRSIPKEANPNCASSSPPPCQNKPEGWLDWLRDHDMRFSWWMQEQGLRIFFYLWLRILEFSGNGICLIPAAAAAYLLPKESLTPEVRTFFFNLLGAFVVDLILVTLIKYYVCRARPLYCGRHITTVEAEPWSFPSNHSTRALMVVTFFTMYLPMWKEQAVNVWLPFFRRLLSNEVSILDDGVHTLSNVLVSIITWLVYSWAVATTSSRIILGRHFFFDVLVGCVVGILEGALYNRFLVIPAEVSEGVHNYIFLFFASIRDAVMKFFNNSSFHA